LETAFSARNTGYTYAPPSPKPVVQPPVQPHTENKWANFDVGFNDAVFETGQLSFLHFFNWYKTPVLFTIKNAWLLPQYDHIKEYFAKALGRKTFSVNTSVTLTDGVITQTNANSSEILLIDAQLIDKIKYKRTLQLATSPAKRKKKTLYTETDIFQNFEDATGGNIFQQSGTDILDFILQSKNVRNESQLKFLSAIFHDPIQKLRFTLNPLFVFVFYTSIHTQHIFCWELLNSHATYLWLLPKEIHSITSAIDLIEEEISLVEQTGREQYRKAKKQSPAADHAFMIIEHTHIHEGEASFENWKQRIEKHLIS
jgi:hypothetical protein